MQEIEEWRQKEQGLIEQAESVSVNGYAIMSMMNLVMRLEQQGVSEIFQMISSIITEDSKEGTWSNVESDLLPVLQDQMAKMTRILKKKFC